MESGTAGLLLWPLPRAQSSRRQRPASGPAESICLPTMTSFRPGAGWERQGPCPLILVQSPLLKGDTDSVEMLRADFLEKGP